MRRYESRMMKRRKRNVRGVWGLEAWGRGKLPLNWILPFSFSSSSSSSTLAPLSALERGRPTSPSAIVCDANPRREHTMWCNYYRNNIARWFKPWKGDIIYPNSSYTTNYYTQPEIVAKALFFKPDWSEHAVKRKEGLRMPRITGIVFLLNSFVTMLIYYCK